VSSVETLSEVIEGFYSLDKTNKVLSLLNEIRNGKYYSASKIRSFLIGHYKSLITNLTPEEYSNIKNIIVQQIPKLINERNSRKIAYSLLSQIIEYSCYHGTDVGVYLAYEKAILHLADISKEKYLYHMITLAQTRKRILGDVENLEDLFIEKYLSVSRIKTINYKYLIDFTINVESSNKRKFLTHLFHSKPFRNEFIINSFILQHEELRKLGVLL